MRVFSTAAVLAAAWLCLAVQPAPAAAPTADPAAVLYAAKRLACAFTHGVNAGFTPQGGVTVKPPLDPNTPGLTIDIIDADKKRAQIEEDDRETPAVYTISPIGLHVMARYPDGGMALVTVYPLYSGASDNFLMVASHHDAATMPKISQRYGLCRAADAPPPAAPAPQKDAGHGHKP
jgi:hypothetical protein